MLILIHNSITMTLVNGHIPFINVDILIFTYYRVMLNIPAEEISILNKYHQTMYLNILQPV